MDVQEITKKYLGRRVKDVVSLRHGVCTGIVTEPFETDRGLVELDGAPAGKAVLLPLLRLIVVEDPTHPGMEMLPDMEQCHRLLGNRVRDRQTGETGICEALVWQAYGADCGIVKSPKKTFSTKQKYRMLSLNRLEAAPQDEVTYDMVF